MSVKTSVVIVGMMISRSRSGAAIANVLCLRGCINRKNDWELDRRTRRGYQRNDKAHCLAVRGQRRRDPVDSWELGTTDDREEGERKRKGDGREPECQMGG